MTAANAFMKPFALSALCMLVLGLALSACFSSNISSTPASLHGAVTVSFDKNNTDAGSTEADPDNLTILPPATTLGSLPAPPTRPGYAFAGWNMQSDGKGEAFTEETPIQGKVHFVVYAQWKPFLNIQLSPGTLGFSPIEGKSSFTVTVSGFKSEADADSVELDFNVDGLRWLLPHIEYSTFAGDTRSFVVQVDYRGLGFTEAPATLKPSLKNIPVGYEAGGTQSLHIVPTNGQNKTRPILVHRRNLEAFNNYARTLGLTLHYQLTENVRLEPPALPQTSNWMAIGTDITPFSGSFDGGGHSISGLTLELSEVGDNDNQGLFGYIRGADAVIQNLVLEEVSISGIYSNNVGAVLGHNSEGRVQNCHVSGNVSGNAKVGGVVGNNAGGTVQNCHATGSVSSSAYDADNVGGVVGYNLVGKVLDCHATGDVAGINYVGGVVGQSSGGEVQNSYAEGTVRGSRSIGGVVGGNSGLVQNCYSKANVTSTGDFQDYSYAGGVVGNQTGSVRSSYATGEVKGINYVGGVVGNNSYNSAVIDCYATGLVEGSSFVGGVVGASNANNLSNPTVVQNCYATGSVSGSGDYVGGVIGYNSNYSAVQNCVALNPSVTQASLGRSPPGRIAGGNSTTGTTLKGNHARFDMRLMHDGVYQNPVGDEEDPNGAPVLAEEYGDLPFWERLHSVGQSEVFWNFTEVWRWSFDSKLTILRGAGGEQNPTV